MKEREILEFLGANNLSVSEFHILNTVHYVHWPAGCLPGQAAAGSEHWFGRLPPASPEECRNATASLLTRGLIQVIDPGALARIESHLAAQPARGPVMDLPAVGDIDFTEAGGLLWQRLERQVFDEVQPCGGYEEGMGPYWSTEDFNEDGTSRMECLGCTERALRSQIARHLREKRESGFKLVSIEGPEPIGAWRLDWWNVVHPRGYATVVVCRPKHPLKPEE